MTHLLLSCREAFPIHHRRAFRSTAGLAAAGVLACCGAASAQCLSVDPGVDYPVVTGQLCAADVDGDGDNDIVLRTGGGLDVLRNDGSGTFTLEPLYDHAGGFSSIAAGDVNGDGFVDFVVGADGGVGVILNQGDYTYGPVSVFGDVDWFSLLNLIDLDGDGDLDVYSTWDRLLVWTNDGTGAFSTKPVRYDLILPGGRLVSVTAADLNGDGFPEIIGANDRVGPAAGPAVQLFENHGDGTFAAPTALVSSTSGCLAVAAGDFDGDGDQDVVHTRIPQLRTLFNDGTGTLTGGPSTSTDVTVNRLVVADFDQDNVVDLVDAGLMAPASYGASLIRRAIGDGTFSVAGAVAGGDMYPYDVIAADFDGDGHPDVALSARSWAGDAGRVTVVMTVTGSPLTDVNHDAVVNSTDVSEFINIWFGDQVEGTLNADFNLDGVSNSTDVSSFINRWFRELGGVCG